jgi:hypothetical protein
MAVALVGLPFPLVVGCSVRPGWKPGSNTAASTSGICAAHENRQLLAHWTLAPLVVCPLMGFPLTPMVFSSDPQHPLPGADSYGLAQGLPEDTIVAGL